MKTVVLFVLAFIAMFVTGCSTVDTKCPVPGCSHKHSTCLSYTVEKVAKKVTYGESEINVERWVAAWSPDSTEEVDMLLSHVRFYVAKERKGLDVDYRKAEWSDANMNWSVDRTKRFVYRLNK